MEDGRIEGQMYGQEILIDHVYLITKNLCFPMKEQ
jgi:hypothetical protein